MIGRFYRVTSAHLADEAVSLVIEGEEWVIPFRLYYDVHSNKIITPEVFGEFDSLVDDVDPGGLLEGFKLEDVIRIVLDRDNDLLEFTNTDGARVSWEIYFNVRTSMAGSN